jgi:peptidoglycan hydrolase-like protein with peptidoglycan-binding domain
MNEKENEEIVDVDVDVDEVIVEEIPKADKQPTQRSNAPAAAKNAAVSGNAVDDVMLSQCVYKNKFARKSLTVHHVQRRLVEWGYRDAGSDKDGWYGDLTKSAVTAFQSAHNIEGAGEMNAATLVALFDGDENVRIVI